MKLVFVLFISIVSIRINAQQDTLRGYYLFNFGENKENIIKILNDRNYTYKEDTSGLDIGAYGNRIEFVDTLVFHSYEKYIIEVNLLFDKENEDRLFGINLQSDECCFNFRTLSLSYQNLVNLYKDKYGNDFEYDFELSPIEKDTNISYPTHVKYTWISNDNEIELNLSLIPFLNKENRLDYENLKKYNSTKKNIDLTIYYRSLKLENLARDNYANRMNKKYFEEQKKLKKKL